MGKGSVDSIANTTATVINPEKILLFSLSHLIYALTYGLPLSRLSPAVCLCFHFRITPSSYLLGFLQSFSSGVR